MYFFSDLTCNGQNLLLMYDACRAHMTLRIVEHFFEYNVVVYALPANTFSKTQPCDAVVFGVYKKEINCAIMKVAIRKIGHIIEVFEFCAILIVSSHELFTRANLVVSFARLRVWLVDESRLMLVTPIERKIAKHTV